LPKLSSIAVLAQPASTMPAKAPGSTALTAVRVEKNMKIPGLIAVARPQHRGQASVAVSTRERRPQRADERVTESSSGEEPRRPLEALGDKGRGALRRGVYEYLGERHRFECRHGGRQPRADTARGARAASALARLLQIAVRVARIMVRCMRIGAVAHLGARVTVARRFGGRCAAVMARPANEHGRRDGALHGHCHSHHPHQRDSEHTKHRQSLDDPAPHCTRPVCLQPNRLDPAPHNRALPTARSRTTISSA
jgi:hypothetical protein